MYCLNSCAYNLIYTISCTYEWKLTSLDLPSTLYVYECDDKLFSNM